MGPCLCGDPYCPRCGSPHIARLEAAEEWMLDRLQKAYLTPAEYRIVVSAGLRAVSLARRASEAAAESARQNYAEENYEDMAREAKDTP